MRLGNFIAKHKELIVNEWESFAKTLTPAAEDMSPLALRNHILDILDFIARDLESDQSKSEQIIKSQGNKIKIPGNSAAETHAALRLAGGFSLDQMISEFRALRASIVKLWRETGNGAKPTRQNFIDLIRFNEAMDQALTESIGHYTRKVTRSRDLVLGVLSHDLRTPLSATLMSARLLPKLSPLNEQQSMLVEQIAESMTRADKIVTNLLDITRSRFGSGMPVVRESMNMGIVGKQLVEEMRTVYPERDINLDISDNLEGEWDKSRIGQVFSNLIGNAIQHGFKNKPVYVTIIGHETDITLSIQNDGIPICASMIDKIFDPLTRSSSDDELPQADAIHLGLGLYITKEIVTAHNGTVCVTSTEEDGTTFTICLPRTTQLTLGY